MKNKKNKIFILTSLTILLSLTSCLKDLDQALGSEGREKTADELFADPAAYKQVLAKLYAGLSITGQDGGSGNADIAFIDEGASSYTRGIFYLQEFTTDEALVGWNDGTIKDFHNHTWSNGDTFLNAMYYRLAFQITSCNEFLRQTTDSKLESRGVNGQLKSDIQVYRAEARFLRALSYWYIIDMFGGGSIATEENSTNYYEPEYASRSQLFAFVDKELNELTPLLKDPKANEQFRVDKVAAWMLKAKLYMNAKVYISEDKFSQAVPFINQIIESGYTLHSNYQQLFMADNDSNGAQNEIILAAAQDGMRTRTYGGTTLLIHAAIGGSMDPASFGVNGGWAGFRTTGAFYDKFGDASLDSRGMFYKIGQTKEIDDLADFTNGYAITKWTNKTSNGNAGSDSTGEFTDTDFPIFRLADAYLMYAECAARQFADKSIAVGYVNKLRERAYGDSSANISVNDLTENFVIDERARELYWEGHRRSDLIRFNKFTGSSYVWPWKGGVKSGVPTSSHRNLFPIPSNAITANPKLKQNTGY